MPLVVHTSWEHWLMHIKTRGSMVHFISARHSDGLADLLLYVLLRPELFDAQQLAVSLTFV